MRILCVHNRYQQWGGEDQVFDSETALLEQYGHDVSRLEFDNAAIPSAPTSLASARIALNTVWSRSSADRVRTAARHAAAEVVHFTNTFPLASPSVYSAARSTGAAVVKTVQNYRTTCPSSNLYRDHGVCEDCIGRSVPWPGVVHACYRDSRPQSAVVAAMIAAHKLRGTWHNDVDAYIAATEFSRGKLIAGGLPADKILVKPNFIDPAPSVKNGNGAHVLFVGRLVEEKGIAPLLSAWSQAGLAVPLHIAGSGPLRRLVEAAAATDPTILPLGNLTRPSILDQMQHAKFLVFPSLWYEGLPVTLVEALACGLPVIASRLGAMAEIIDDGRTGVLFEPGDHADLAAKLQWAFDHPEELEMMGTAAREEFESTYTAERNYAMLMVIYSRALGNRDRRTAAEG